MAFVITISGVIDEIEHDVESLEIELADDIRSLIDRWRHHIRVAHFNGDAHSVDLSPPPLPDEHSPMTAHATVEDVSGDVG